MARKRENQPNQEHGTLARMLVIEGNAVSVSNIRDALRRARVRVNMRAIRHTDGFTGLAGDELPDIVLVDGEVLEKNIELREHLERMGRPLAVMGETRSDGELSRAYDSGACCYVTAPLDLQKIGQIVHSMDDMWLDMVKTGGERPGKHNDS